MPLLIYICFNSMINLTTLIHRRNSRSASWRSAPGRLLRNPLRVPARCNHRGSGRPSLLLKLISFLKPYFTAINSHSHSLSPSPVASKECVDKVLIWNWNEKSLIKTKFQGGLFLTLKARRWRQRCPTWTRSRRLSSWVRSKSSFLRVMCTLIWH